MDSNPVVELEHDEPVIRDFAARDVRIHDVVEAGLATDPLPNGQ